MASTTPFTHKSFPVFPGAFMLNEGNGSFPIFCSVYDFSRWGMNDIDNYYIVMPGYKLLTYQSIGYTYSSSLYNGIFDNTTGTAPKYYTISYSNLSSSCYLYYKGNEIKLIGISDTESQTPISISTNTSTTNIGNQQIPSNMPLIYKTMPIYPGAYLINHGCGAIPIFCSIKNFVNFAINDQDNYYIIMPGYSLIVYRDPDYVYNNTNNTFKNNYTSGFIYYATSPSNENASSCKLFLGDVTDASEIRIQGISY
jgi:hypothetical protein